MDSSSACSFFSLVTKLSIICSTSLIFDSKLMASMVLASSMFAMAHSTENINNYCKYFIITHKIHIFKKYSSELRNKDYVKQRKGKNLMKISDK